MHQRLDMDQRQIHRTRDTDILPAIAFLTRMANCKAIEDVGRDLNTRPCSQSKRAIATVRDLRVARVRVRESNFDVPRFVERHGRVRSYDTRLGLITESPRTRSDAHPPMHSSARWYHFRNGGLHPGRGPESRKWFDAFRKFRTSPKPSGTRSDATSARLIDSGRTGRASSQRHRCLEPQTANALK